MIFQGVEIKSFYWEVTGDSLLTPLTSSSINPRFKLTTGIYYITLTVTMPDDTTHVITDKSTINVYEDNDSLVSTNYLESPKCFTLGFEDSTGMGWSENAGTHWLWPPSRHAVTHKKVNGSTYTLVWDLYDQKQYVMNVSDTADFSATFLDKDIHAIESSVKTLNMTGDLEIDSLTHLETLIDMKPARELEGYLDGMSVDASISTSTNGEPVETREGINPDKEITFYYQNEKIVDSNERVIGVHTNNSGFRIEAIESYFRTNRKFRAATDPYRDVNTFFNTYTAYWLTRGHYGRDRGLGELVKYITPNPGFDDTVTYPDFSTSSYVYGPDNIIDSAIVTDFDYLLTNVLTTGMLMFWSTDVLTTFNGYTLTTELSRGDWYLYTYTGDVSAALTLPTAVPIFDFRILDATMTTEAKYEMVSSYADNLERFLPGY